MHRAEVNLFKYKALRSHQAGRHPVAANHFFGVLSHQFDLSEAQTEVVVNRVLRRVKEALPEEDVSAVEEALPAELAKFLEAA